MDLSIDLFSCIMVFGISTLGATLQGSIGFGLGLIGVPLLVMINPVFVPGPILLAALGLTTLISRREHRSIKIKEIKWAIVGRLAGTGIGAVILTIIAKNSLSMLFGTMVLIAVAISISGIKLKLTPENLLVSGTFSGIMSITAAIGGAPMALAYQHQKGPKLRGSLSSIFIFGTIISISTLVFIRRFGLIEIKAALILVPGVLLGYFISNHTAKLLDRGFIRPALLTASAISGIIVIIRSLT